MTELFLQTGHLSDEGLQALIDGMLDEMQRLEAAEHLSFCDECLARYTALLTGDVLEEPEQDVTLPVMRRLRRRAVKIAWNRYAAAAAAVVITAGLWYSGVFGGAMEALAVQPPALEQTAQEQQPGPLGQLLERIEGKPNRPDNGLGPEHRPDNIHQLDEPDDEPDEEPEQETDGGLGQWLSQFLDRNEN
ncbi:hypothetical protein [Gemmiger sp. An194]|uniref:anti-sigma factor family protein n=1 Tax=Gemmiger sp. An194 TaxID=1965582 RepID=UPI000B3A6D65|nr:hypothetical protein [Gemmiger sp. An194]OUP23853.1 hypothetical protein B5F28_09230 [Gemmiger sp. An194]